MTSRVLFDASQSFISPEAESELFPVASHDQLQAAWVLWLAGRPVYLGVVELQELDDNL